MSPASSKLQLVLENGRRWSEGDSLLEREQSERYYPGVLRVYAHVQRGLMDLLSHELVALVLQVPEQDLMHPLP